MIYYRKHSNPDILTPPDLLAKAMREMDVDFELWCEDEVKANNPHWAFDNYRLGGAIDYNASHLFYTQPSWGLFFSEKMGKNKVKLLTYAVDEEIYPEVKEEKTFDIGFIGNISDGDGRLKLFELLQVEFKCFISNNTATQCISKELAKCKVILNPIRYEEVNIRFFESLASGAQLCSYSQALNLFAEENKHYMTYKSQKELLTKIKYLLDNPDIRENMAKEARKEVLRRHTYKHRVREILNFL